MAIFTDQQLQDAWDFYKNLSAADMVTYTNSESAMYDASFVAILGYIYTNRLFGFANYNFPSAGSNQFRGNIPITNGPIKS